MNFYFLVEGDDESVIYPQWLAHLRPELQRVRQFDEAVQNHYYLFNAKGYPKILNEALPLAIIDVNFVGNYDYLVVCFDADEDTITEREQEVADVLQVGQNQLQPPTQLIPMIQNRCIETWLLGNRAIYTDNPKNNELKSFLSYYHAAYADPELMGNPKTIYKSYYRTHARFHKRYFQVLLDELGIRQAQRLEESSKKNYLDQLQARVSAEPSHLQTFQTFMNFCQRII